MKLKEKIARLLVKVARRLAPQRYDRVETLTGYEPMKLGIAFVVSQSELSSYYRQGGKSYAKARIDAIEDMKKRVRQSIYASLVDGRHIEYTVRQKGEDTFVEGYIRIYKRKS